MSECMVVVGEGVWSWSRDGVRVEATEPTRKRGSIRAVLSVFTNGELAHRDRLLLTSGREREKYRERVEEAGVELDPPVLLALEEAIRGSLGTGRDHDDPGKGTRIILEDPEPWPDPVDGSRLLSDMTEWISDHVHLHPAAVRSAVLWAVASWFVEVLYFAPPLVLRSPTKRAGKTLLLDLLKELVRRGYPTSGIGVTAAVLFRLNDEHRPTFLIDEAERLGGSGADRDLVGLLNNGYRRGGCVSRCVEPDWKVVQFDAFGFRALAAIGSLWDTIEDRAVIIRLQRKPKHVQVRRFSARRVAREGHEFARRAARWVADHAEEIAEVEEEAPRPRELDDRACDSWAPLFAVAAVAGGEWPALAMEAALELSTGQEDEDRAEKMIHDLRRVFEEHGYPEAIASGDLVEKLNKIETSPWGDLRGGDGLTPHKLAAILRPFEVGPEQRRDASGAKVRGWWLVDLEPLFTRYPPPTPPSEVGQVGQSNDSAGLERFQSGTETEACPTSKSAENPCATTNVPVVPVQKGGVEDTPPDPETDPERFERWAIQHEHDPLPGEVT